MKEILDKVRLEYRDDYEKFINKATEKQGRKVLEALGCVDSEEKLFCLQSPDVEAFIDPELGVSLAPVQV